MWGDADTVYSLIIKAMASRKKDKVTKSDTGEYCLKMLLHIFCIFCCIACASVEAVKCNFCQQANSDYCLPEGTHDCEEKGCAAASGFFQNGLEKISFIHKGCGFPVECNSWLCISMNGIYMQSFITCCQEEFCNLDYYIPSDEDELDNGKVCESCFQEGSTDECISPITQQCRGDETLCVDYRGHLIKPDGNEAAISFKGCANTLAYEHFDLFYSFQETQRLMFKSTEATEVIKTKKH